MKNKIFILLFLAVQFGQLYAQDMLTKALGYSDGTTVLYNSILNNKGKYPELLLNDVACNFTQEGLVVKGKNNIIQLDKKYALAERLVRYHVRFSADAKAVFQSNSGDFKLIIDVPQNRATVETNPLVWRRVDIIPEHDYIIEIQKEYQKTKVVIANLSNGDIDELEIVADGPGGYGVGEVRQTTGMMNQWDMYCFGLQEGTSLTVRQIIVQAMDCNLTLLIYGDSQTQPEGYFPNADFHLSWTQLIKQKVRGKTVSSGRGGCTINEVQDIIRNELPFVKAKYVMVTIGTNGGNTEENLTALMSYIIEQGSIPILNNIPSNESHSQREDNPVIEKVRQQFGIKGARFDLPTSINNDGIEVDTTTMWHEDYTERGWKHFFHHPNVKGSRLMYLQTWLDVPEIYQ